MEPNVHFKGRDIINGYDFNNQELCTIMDTAMLYEKRVKSGEVIHDMDGLIVASLFFEASTRTRMSFDAAINRTGARCINLGDVKTSSQSKGETWQDTILTVDGYVDCIVMRSPIAAFFVGRVRVLAIGFASVCMVDQDAWRVLRKRDAARTAYLLELHAKNIAYAFINIGLHFFNWRRFLSNNARGG